MLRTRKPKIVFESGTEDQAENPDHSLIIEQTTELTSLPNDLQNLIKKLDFLAMIKQNYKIDTKNNVLFDNNSWAVGELYKWWNRKAEDRFTTIDFIKKTIDETIIAISKYEKTEFIRYLINSLSSARIGISKLEITYRNDQNFISELSVIIKNIDIPLNNYKHLITGCC